MKQKIYLILIITLAYMHMSTFAFAQTPQTFPYQAVARDINGNLVSNQTISLRFSVIDGSMIGPYMLQETHTVTTNNLGLFTVNIGQGTINGGTFSSINWASGLKYLKVEMDIAGGTNFIEMGITQLLSVPYALHAGNIPSGTGNGNTMHWNGTSWLSDNTLYNDGTKVGIGAINNTAWKLHVSGKDSAMKISGTGPIQQYGQLNFGDANYVYLREDLDDKLTINANRISLQGGNIGINTLLPAARLQVESADVIFTAPASLPLNGANPSIEGVGNRMMWYADKAAFRVGASNATNWNKDSIGIYSFASGYYCQAKGSLSIAGGSNSYANGSSSIALGNNALAFAENAIAIGNSTRAYGYNSMAFGPGSEAFGNSSLALGYNSEANGDVAMVSGSYNKSNGFACTVIGIYNDTIVAPQSSPLSTTPLFIIGNGDFGNSIRKNAFVVRNNGRVGVGVNANTYQFEVATNSAAKPSSSSWTISSDARLKTLDGDYEKGLSEILKLNTIRYHYSENNARKLPTDEQSYGFIAQEVQKVFPECVKENEDGYLSLDMHPILVSYVNAFKELNTKFESQKIMVDQQAKDYEQLKNQNENMIKQLDELKQLIKNAKL